MSNKLKVSKCCENCGFNSARGQDPGCEGCLCHTPKKERKIKGLKTRTIIEYWETAETKEIAASDWEIHQKINEIIGVLNKLN